MPGPRKRADRSHAIALVAPSARRARAAARELGGLWKRQPVTPCTLAAFLAGPEASRVLLCPAGRKAEADLAFLTEARRRVLWPPPEADLGAAVAGLRGEHPASPRSLPAKETRSRGRKSALLMEGIVSARRAELAATSAQRDWIAESPFHVRVAGPRLRELAARGVRWFALRPVRLEAVLASPILARSSRSWRGLLPPGTRVRVLQDATRR